MKINYSIRNSARARRVRLTVRPGGGVVVTVPRGVALIAAQQFVAHKMSWLEKAVARMRKVRPRVRLPVSSYRDRRAEAEAAIRRRLNELSTAYGYSYNSLSIRNQKTRWGSCSRHGNLSFNYRLVLLPQELADYIIVHELCHLAEFNHSRRFWSLVAKAIPDYAIRRRALRQYDLRLS